ncbi:hypothetical protein M8J76_006236 [Diaphorina citri]|nr:hypothetical protein M8J75_007358 [Diaphorina citri]KAI5732968.1 hypothetical protein M8J76_006236 [Diaphorina citri]
MVREVPAVTSSFVLVLVLLKCGTGDHVSGTGVSKNAAGLSEDTAGQNQGPEGNHPFGTDPDEEQNNLTGTANITGANHEDILEELDDRIDEIKTKIGSLYSRNSALLHRMNKVDDYIKRGADMETRYVIEIMGYPFDQEKIPPEEFLGLLANALNINFTQRQVRGLRMAHGVRRSDARLIVEFGSAKDKKTWLRAYKRKLYEISWGDPEKAFGTKENYKFIQHKMVYLQDFLPTLCEIHAVGPVPFAINEYMSPYRKRLLSYAKLLCAEYKWRFVWVSEGDIFIREKHGSPGNYVRSERDFRAIDWRLEKEEFFWKKLNECNAKRRELYRGTTKRILPWMTTNDDSYVKRRTYKESLLNYRRKFDVQLKQMLGEQEYSKYASVPVGETYNFRTLSLNLSRHRTTSLRNFI